MGRTEEVNPTLKVKVRDRHEERRAYHGRALVEPASIFSCIATTPTVGPPPSCVTNDRMVNPGRLPEGVADEVGDGCPWPVRSVRVNFAATALSAIFFGMSVMERAGTGCPTLSFAREGDGGGLQRPAGKRRLSGGNLSTEGVGQVVLRRPRHAPDRYLHREPDGIRVVARGGVEGGGVRHARNDLAPRAFERDRHGFGVGR